MLKNKFSVVLFAIIVLSVGCARRGNITGGLKDTLAPVLKYSLPKNYSTLFKGNEIKLFFDEYVILKDVNKQLVVSPPMKTAPDITPVVASKYISIKIKDTLQPNTTYRFNFGRSIQDNNEGNPYPEFKYVFSTGTEIDSLKIEGTIKDALERTSDNFVSVMLYEKNETYNDSAIYKQKPRYVTNTLDSLKTWKIENIKAGKYVLVALKDFNNNFRFDAKKDKIGFYKEDIVVPSTKNYELELFKEKPTNKFLKPFQASGNRTIIPFEGDTIGIKTVLKNGDNVLQTIITKVAKKDSLQLWYKKIKVDSLQLSVSKNNAKNSYYFKIRELKKDTLNISPTQSGTLDFRKPFSVVASTPIVKFDKSKISIRDKDSAVVVFSTKYDVLNQELTFDFKKDENQKYTFKFLPGAVTDFFDKSNDTLVYKLNTKPFADFGNFILKLENVKRYPIIVQLLDEKGTVLDSEYSENSPTVKFDLIEPRKLFFRIIYDDNKNRVWDPGNYLSKTNSEEVIYFTKTIDVRPNWDVDQPFILSK